jgi:HEAT repeat protein
MVFRLALAESEPFDAKRATFDELFFHVQRYATTPAKKQRKQAAREELLARRAESLAYLMDHIHIQNDWFPTLAEQVAGTLKAEEAAPVLVRYLTSGRDGTRKFAAYFMGFYDTPQYADSVMPLLQDDKTAGAAIRTLGKWHVRRAVPFILPFLLDVVERRRIVAVTALGDIGDPAAIPHLMRTLGDPCFTVRKATSCSLSRLGLQAEEFLCGDLDRSTGVSLREEIRILGKISSRRAVRRLRTLVEDPDRSIRTDAAMALYSIDAGGASRWLHGTRAEEEVAASGRSFRIRRMGGAP